MNTSLKRWKLTVTDGLNARKNLIYFVLMFTTLYAAFGVASPFLPTFLASRGLAPEQIGLILSLSTLIRLISGPLAGHIADHLHALRFVLTACTLFAAAVVPMFLSVEKFSPLLIAALFHAAMLAPTTILADALALRGAVRDDVDQARFEYGWVRGAGSAAFIVGALVVGYAVDAVGAAATLLCQAVLLAIASAVTLLVPEPDIAPASAAESSARSGRELREMLQNRVFFCVILISALVLGSHAMHDSFAIIAWKAAGISSSTGSLLWSESVAAEVVVFFWVGPRLLRHFGAKISMAAAAAAAAIRWAVMAQTSNAVALAFLEPLHGLTFALLHLSCMHVLVRIVPAGLAATAQAVYALASGTMTAMLMLLSGSLYAAFGAGGFFVMAGVAAASLPLVLTLGRIDDSNRS